MRAAVVPAPEEAPRYGEFPDPQAGPDDVLLDLVAAAVHPLVRSRARGTHYSSGQRYPMVPGMDGVGRTREGALVYAGEVHEPWGTFADRFAAPRTRTVPLPDGIDPVAVAASMNPGMSSWMPITEHLAGGGALGTVLVLGATGTAGGLAVQNSRRLGAGRVVGAGRGADALVRVLALGAEPVELTGDADADVQSLAAALDGEAPALVLDYLWGAPAEVAFRALAAGPAGDGTLYVEVGAVAGPTAAMPAALLRSRRFRVRGSGIGSVDMSRYRDEAVAYLGRIASGAVVVPTVTFPLERVADAWQATHGPRAVVTPV
ncbi:zinc-binding alcohol dehydrogenase family protein [Cellulomonas sp. zg-ZUI199]|uniref:Zinc-binding alcohol dehydrogenase family protein n=1 Tax=Cellulomonas wangleii TaxID=2816956 RepID=A0ABX8D7B9_9CELL|nr:zinc-binding alcohol dehydrogenase family protein [Cellulomonas wangleii]MBO0923288.1 zinc-binding alcohol dehydrogenase family protein [Cellulomonas wangleii]QVI61647.1 zinc-binding alcohol dehydrogenase family protein [Cellulomonas wangleii]